MARKAVIERELRKIKTCDKFRKKREALRTKLSELRKDPAENYDELLKLQDEFSSLPRNASPCRIRRRCRITGRSRGVYRKVGLSRSMFRLHAMHGEIPGLVKSSW